MPSSIDHSNRPLLPFVSRQTATMDELCFRSCGDLPGSGETLSAGIAESEREANDALTLNFRGHERPGAFGETT